MFKCAFIVVITFAMPASTSKSWGCAVLTPERPPSGVVAHDSRKDGLLHLGNAFLAFADALQAVGCEEVRN